MKIVDFFGGLPPKKNNNDNINHNENVNVNANHNEDEKSATGGDAFRERDSTEAGGRGDW